MTPYLAVLDFEATCADKGDPDWSSDRQEIIELPVALVSVERRERVATFHTMVRPTLQPTLTAFCTELTSIRQEEVDGQPTIVEAMAAFAAWIDEHALTPETCTVVTCGDWDLKRCWPKQASLVPGLATPPLFRRWCNLKVPYREHMGHKAPGMIGMLKNAGIEHVGRHHRGIDDVKNIEALALWLIEAGVAIEPTWTEADRAAEAARVAKKLAGQRQSREERVVARDRLPARVPAEVRERIVDQLARLDAEIERLKRLAAVFA